MCFSLSVCLLQVTGVVGRAETLSSVFFLAAFIFYTKATRRKRATGKFESLQEKITEFYQILPQKTAFVTFFAA